MVADDWSVYDQAGSRDPTGGDVGGELRGQVAGGADGGQVRQSRNLVNSEYL